MVVPSEPDHVHEFSRSTLDEGADELPKRTQLALPDAQRDPVRAVNATETPTVVVFVTGRVLATPWIADNVPGISMAY